MIGLFTFVVRAVLLVGFTFGFVVLFEHGPQGFVAGVPVEVKNLEKFAASLTNKQVVEPAPSPTPAAVEPVPVVPSPTATPLAAPPGPQPDKPPSAWEKLQSTPMGEAMDLPVGTTSN